MRRLGVTAVLLLAFGASTLGWLAVRGPASAADQDEGEPVWVAIEFVDQEQGLGSEFFGRVDSGALAEVLDGRRREGYLRLDRVFWVFDDGEVERLDDDFAYRDTSYFRIDAIRRVTPLKDDFPEGARAVPPGDRIVPGPGHDA